ncbi:unnamed protein product [Zymoseptoria tritici ST99CH_3D7]|uniref:Uncharacterized protein n=1 Tax=Zymoseptoria tritici (strain ST99CH_3D7) TaxID=1276538 RepID=A0A1X7S5D7_ZYMT9|nr:unnamed protein product [Zymoseptoria tritici ST99CH_3D7]
MADLVADCVALSRKAGFPYVLRMTTITSGHLKGQTVIEVIGSTGFRFLDLPIELRDRIYRLILIQSEPILLSALISLKSGTKLLSTKKFPYDPKYHHKSTRWSCGPQSWLSLLAVSKQIQAEVAPIAYGANTFKQDSSTALSHFAPKIGSFIQHLAVVDFGQSCTWVNIRRTLNDLKQAKGLRKLIFEEGMLLHALFMVARKDDHQKMAAIMSKDLSDLLMGLQNAYKASGRTWKAADVPCLRSDEEYRGKPGSKEAQRLMKRVCKLNEEYL